MVSVGRNPRSTASSKTAQARSGFLFLQRPRTRRAYVPRSMLTTKSTAQQIIRNIVNRTPPDIQTPLSSQTPEMR
uniref:Uncharacterized protein n=1 Tax=Solanum lycopersicum TaxID=4081 RepID=A0A3Q7I862_SOLLC